MSGKETTGAVEPTCLPEPVCSMCHGKGYVTVPWLPTAATCPACPDDAGLARWLEERRVTQMDGSHEGLLGAVVETVECHDGEVS